MNGLPEYRKTKNRTHRVLVCRVLDKIFSGVKIISRRYNNVRTTGFYFLCSPVVRESTKCIVLVYYVQVRVVYIVNVLFKYSVLPPLFLSLSLRHSLWSFSTRAGASETSYIIIPVFIVTFVFLKVRPDRTRKNKNFFAQRRAFRTVPLVSGGGRKSLLSIIVPVLARGSRYTSTIQRCRWVFRRRNDSDLNGSARGSHSLETRRFMRLRELS
jgi:hypothetical protein